MIVVSCVLFEGIDVKTNSAGVFTPEWVDRLYRGVRRHLTVPFRFVCYVDQEYDFQEPIESRPLVLPHRNMLSLLEVFRETEHKTVFMGLDTIITGNIDFLAEFDGFWMLDDPYFDRPCSGVMVFDPQPDIWAEIEKQHQDIATRDLNEWGMASDMAYLAHHHPRRLDGVAHGVLSYKAHLMGAPYNIKHTRIVYFHGEPKPHDLAGVSWVDEYWGEPLTPRQSHIQTLNNSSANMLANVKANRERGLPTLEQQSAHGRAALLVGGGPSLADTLPTLQATTGDVVALNGTHDYLVSRGIIPDMHIVMDSRPENVCFVQNPLKSVRYFLAAQCDPSLFDALEGQDTTIWYSCEAGVMEIMAGWKVVIVTGGNTVGMKSLFLLYLLGYREIHLFGFDSCYRGSADHAYPQSLNADSQVIDVTAAGRKFRCAPWMSMQAEWFQKQARTLHKLGCQLCVHGDGLIAHIVKTLNEDAA